MVGNPNPSRTPSNIWLSVQFFGWYGSGSKQKVVETFQIWKLYSWPWLEIVADALSPNWDSPKDEMVTNLLVSQRVYHIILSDLAILPSLHMFFSGEFQTSCRVFKCGSLSSRFWVLNEANVWYVRSVCDPYDTRCLGWVLEPGLGWTRFLCFWILNFSFGLHDMNRVCLGFGNEAALSFATLWR